MAKTIYESAGNNLVGESIDEVILRLLGLENIFDLDYETYRTLLKEGMLAGRMKSTKMASAETEKLTDEFKRIKRKTGRFKIKEKKVNVSSFTRQKPKDTRTYTGPQRRLRPTKTQLRQKSGTGLVQKFFGFDPETGENIEDVGEEIKSKRPKKDRDSVMDFLKKVLAPSLTKIEKNLESILDVMIQQSELKESAQEKDRVTGEKEKKRDREEKSEKGRLAKFGDDLKKKVTKPFTDFFDMIKKFFLNILLGALALKLIDILQNPKKFFADLINPVIEFFNGFIKFVWDGLFFPTNFMIDRINEGLQGLQNLLKALPGVDETEISEIPTIEAPQIPLIKAPTEPEGGQPTEGMTGGGQVDQNTGEKVTGMGRDTQLVALEPGEVVMSKKAVEAYGADTLLGMNSSAGGTNRPIQGKVLGYSGGGIVEHLHGDPSRPGYRADHGSVSNAHDHFAFTTEELRKAVQNGLANGEGPSGRKYQIGSTTGGKHADQSYHYVGKAFDIPWSQFGSGAISQKDFDQSATLLKDVQALVRKNGGSAGKSPSGTQSQPQTPMIPGSSKPVSGDLQAEGPKGFKSTVHPSSSAKGMYEKLGINENVWRTYKDTIASIETSGNVNDAAGSYSVIGGSGGAYDGRYQMGKYARIDAARMLGIPVPSRQQLRSDPQLQEDMFVAYTAANYGYMMKGSQKFRDATPIQRMQYLGYAHNQGWSKAADWLETGVISSVDGFGTKGTKFTDKLAKTLKPYTGRDISGSSETPPSTTGDSSSYPSPVPGAPSITPYRPEDTMSIDLGPTSTGSPMMTASSRTQAPGPPIHRCPPKAPKIVAPPKDPSQGKSSSSIGNPSKKDGFSPIDLGNPDLIIIKSIYNIVG